MLCVAACQYLPGLHWQITTTVWCLPQSGGTRYVTACQYLPGLHWQLLQLSGVCLSPVAHVMLKPVSTYLVYTGNYYNCLVSASVQWHMLCNSLSVPTWFTLATTTTVWCLPQSSGTCYVTACQYLPGLHWQLLQLSGVCLSQVAHVMFQPVSTYLVYTGNYYNCLVSASVQWHMLCYSLSVPTWFTLATTTTVWCLPQSSGTCYYTTCQYLPGLHWLLLKLSGVSLSPVAHVMLQPVSTYLVYTGNYYNCQVSASVQWHMLCYSLSVSTWFTLATTSTVWCLPQSSGTFYVTACQYLPGLHWHLL